MSVLPIRQVSGSDLQLLQRRRKQVLVIGVMFGLLLLAVFDSPWRTHWQLLYRTIQWSGLLLIFACIIGRTWCTLYIGGQKKRELVTKGPYSVMRNPLYGFTLVGAAGVGALSGSLTLAFLCVAFATAVFLSVVRREEQFLLAAFPSEYPAYAERVPRFWPRLSAWQDAERVIVHPRLVNRTFLDASVFLLAVPLIALKALLRDLGWLPILLQLP